MIIAAVAAAVALPSGWMAVPPPDQSASQCALYATRSWAVAVRGAELSISPAPPLERDVLPFTPHVPPSAISAAGDTGNRHALRVADGWLVGFDVGRQQGSLWWFAANGSQSDKLFGYDAAAWNQLSAAAQSPASATVGQGPDVQYPAIGNVRAIVQLKNGIIALTGGSSASSDAGQGGALAVSRSGGSWHVAPLAVFDGAPRAYTLESPSSLLVLTDNGVSRVSIKTGSTPITAFEHRSLSVDSIAAGPGGSIFIGMQQYIVRLDRAPNEYEVHWFAPSDCPLFTSTGGRDCRCVAASGAKPYMRRYRATNPEPTRIVVATDGALWWTEPAAHRVGRIAAPGTSVTQTSVAEFPAEIDPSSDLVAAPNGAVWFSSGTSAITRMAADGTSQPVGLSAIAGWTPTVDRLATGADGGLWFVADGSTKIVRVNPDGSLVPASIPEPQFDQLGVAAQTGGSMWFTVASADQVGVLTAAGDVRLYTVPALGSGPEDPVRGPDGNIWFLETISGNLGDILPDGRVRETPITTASGFGSAIVAGAAYGFVLGPDSNFWITEPDDDTIVKVAPSGQATDIATPRGGHPSGIAVGPDGALWFTEPGTGKIGRVTTSGAISEFALPQFEIVRYL